MSHKTRRAASGGSNILEFGFIAAHLDGNNNPSTTAGAGLGTAHDNRWIIVSIGNGNTRSISSITINGETASELATYIGGTNTRASFWAALVASGTTGDIVINFSGNPFGVSLGVWRAVTRDGTLTLHDSDGQTHSGGVLTFSLNTELGGAALALSQSQNASTHTWSGLTERFDHDINSTDYGSGADSHPTVQATGSTITATNADTTPGTMVGVAVSVK